MWHGYVTVTCMIYLKNFQNSCIQVYMNLLQGDDIDQLAHIEIYKDWSRLHVIPKQM